MSDYIIEMRDAVKLYEIAKSSFKVKHFRQYEGRNASAKGGHTVLFDTENGKVYSSKCRSDESFSRRKGILTCIQKMFDAETGLGKAVKIHGHEFFANGVIVYLTRRSDNLPGKKEYYWL